MNKHDRDEVREHRIENEIIVDCYDGDEQVAGWYCYLEEKLTFPFKAKCIKEVRKSPLKVGEVIKVIGMADQEDCEHEMLVMIEFKQRELGVPLSQLEAIKVDDATNEAIADWHYWKNQDYTF